MNKFQLVICVEELLQKMNEDQLRALYLFLSQMISQKSID